MTEPLPAPPKVEAVYSAVIADDDGLVVEALSGLIDDHAALELAGAALSGHEAAELCAQHRPDLVVLDVAMPLGGLDGLAAVKEASPESIVVFYTAQADRRTRERLIVAGATAVFSKGAAIDLASELHDLVASGTTQQRVAVARSSERETAEPTTAQGEIS